MMHENSLNDKKGLDPQYIAIGTLTPFSVEAIHKAANCRIKSKTRRTKRETVKKLSKVLFHFLSSGVFQEMLLNMQG